jgi:NADPH:quinone reductase-like Zn-dependent oxidoreductase
MRKLQIDAIGAPADAVSLVEFDTVSPGVGQIVVEMEAATINASDFLYVTGQYFLVPSAHSDVGAEGVGRVTALGSDVDDALLGARVVLLPSYRHGTWATHVVASVSDVVVAPREADVLQLAMVGINPMTALRLLRDYGNPEADARWIGQTAGNSAVGEYLVKLAKHYGHRTLSVVRREAAAGQVRSWGGDVAVVDGDDLGTRLAAALGEDSLDVAVDSIGGSAGTALARRLRFGGSLVTYAYLSGRPPSVDLADLIGNHANLTGFWLYNWMRRAEPKHVQDAYREVIDLVADGTLSARVEATVALDDFRDAFALSTRPGREGKVLFTFG